MDDDDEIYGRIWISQVDLTVENPKENCIPKPPPRNESLRTHFSEVDLPNSLEEFSLTLPSDIISQSCLSFEGESVENLDINFPTFDPINDKSPVLDEVILPPRNVSKIEAIVPFPKQPCFSEFDGSSSLEYYGHIMQICQKLTTSRKDRYGVLFHDKFILFKKPEHKVSKIQIPINRIKDIHWYATTNFASKNDCNKFKIDTTLRPYKFQCSSHDNAGLWINHIGKLLIQRGDSIAKDPPLYILKAVATIENVKGKRIFTLEHHYTLAYYESEEDFCHDIAMHRVQLRSSGVRRDMVNNNSLELITSYRKYKLSFENSSICDQWFQSLSSVIHKAISSTTVSQSVKTGDNVMEEIYSNVSNRRCGDCGKDSPEWASVNLFVTLCNNCSGIHRGLGRHISLVQGILTDEVTWQDPNIVKLFIILGNKNINEFFLASKVAYGGDRRFISDKYVKKSFIGRKELIFDRYNDQHALNDELLKAVKTDDVMRTMKLYHLGANLNYTERHSGLTVFEAAEKAGQHLQVSFLNNQSRNVIRDWRVDLFSRHSLSQNSEPPLQERLLYCSINGEKRELRQLLIFGSFFQILHYEDTKAEICKVFFENVCLVREKEFNVTDQVYIAVVVRETDFSAGNIEPDQTINTIELFSCNMDQSNDVRDFKNVIATKMCPSFRPTTFFDCMGWIILCTPTEEWRPYLSVLTSNRHLDFHDPKENNNNLISLKLDLRKVQKIEEMKDQSFQTSCPYTMYNMASICLVSSVIYHIRSDSRSAHEEHLDAYKQSWNRRDLSLSNQFLTKDNVPLAVHKMIQFLQVHGCETEGTFRRVGSVKEAEKIYNELTKDPGSFMLKDCTAHDVASALKLFFRKLEDPLLTRKLFKSWIAAVEIRDSQKQLEEYKKIVSSLPPVNYQTLRLLIFLLVEIVENNRVTQMDPSNLATSFNTCLLLSGNSGDPIFSHRNLAVLPFLLEHYKYLFDVTKEELAREELIRKGREQMANDKTSCTLLRQVCVSGELAGYQRADVNFDREVVDGDRELLVRQVIIGGGTTSESLIPALFGDQLDGTMVVLVEERTIEDVHLMCRIIYGQESLFATITYVETFDAKAARRWIFKPFSINKSVPRPARDRHYKRWAYLSQKAKNKMFVELNDTGQLNFWKNDHCQELLANFSIRSLLLYRGRRPSKLIAFKEKIVTPSTVANSNSSSNNNLPKIFQNFPFSSSSKPSPYTYVNFLDQDDCDQFLAVYDEARTEDLVPLAHRTGLPVCV